MNIIAYGKKKDIEEMKKSYNADEKSVIELISEHNNLYKIENIEDQKKPDNFTFLNNLGFRTDDITNYKHQIDYTNTYENQLKQLRKYVTHNNLEAILHIDLINFTSNNKIGDRYDAEILYDLFINEQVLLKTNDIIENDIKRFLPYKNKKKNYIYFTIKNSYDTIIHFIGKDQYNNIKKESTTNQTPIHWQKQTFYILHQKYKNIEAIKKSEEDYYSNIIGGELENYVILYPMKKFGLTFWIIVSDSTKLIKAKTFDEYVKDNTEPEYPSDLYDSL